MVSEMKFKKICVHAAFNERTGYGIHATNFFNALEKLIPIDREGLSGDIHISLLDVVTASQTDVRHPYPSILYTVWESTEYPAAFLDKIRLYDQLWVPSEWQRSCSIAQGIPEEFVKVVPEGVDPNAYAPVEYCGKPNDIPFTFVHIGQWQPRKSTLEIIQAYQKAFPLSKDPLGQITRLELSVDTLFPSDTYKSTEERLVANGINDPRISVIHFEEREAYIRRIQSADCFVSCSRSEGWFLPLCESMACGIPSIAADFGGSTEYAMEAVNVRISKLIKPFGIYGNWDVPGMWAEPDYDHLVECMQDVYTNYSSHKEKALKASDFIRTKFSWDAAAVKAMKIINDIPATIPGADPVSTANPSSPEESIRRYARELGYDIDTMHSRKAIFTIDTHPTSQDKINTLVETIKQIKAHNLPLLVTSHVPLPAPIIEMVDYYIYDKRDILSGDDLPVYWRRHPDGKQETTHAKIPCHALAGLHNIRNAIDFCLGKYDWVYSMTYDAEVDLAEWFKTVYASDKDMILIKYENRDDGVDTKLMAGKTSAFDKILGRFDTWEQYAAFFKEDRFCSEKKYHEIVKDKIGLDNVEFITMDVGNRFDQVDRDAWADDMFTCHFIDGPFLQINGISNREYDVTFGNPVNGDRFFHLAQKVGTWGRPSIKYYRDWTIKAVLTENGTSRVAFEHHMDLKDKRVLVSLGSKALGDTLAWMPYVEEFRKKHNCHVICSTWWNTIMDYPEIEFAEPGSQVANIYATYEVGCYDEQPDKNPANWRTVPLQKVAADILGLEYEPIKCKLKQPPVHLTHKPYICFSEFSTMQNKFWNNPGAWQKTIDYLVSLGYECVSISSEPSQLKNITKHNGQSIDDTIRDIAGADFYVGLNHGPSWIAYSLGIPFIMITGVSEEWNDAPNPYRVAINNDVCGIGCFNDPSLPINRGWEWCPRGKNYACTREITPEMVAQTIDRLMADYGLTENGKEEDNATEKGIVG